MKLKTFFIGIGVIVLSGLIFFLPGFSMEELIIPAFFFCGISGGLYAGYIRKRSITKCMYDGFIIGFPGSFLLALIITPIFGYLSLGYIMFMEYLRLFGIMLAGTLLLTGLIGSPVGGLAMGYYYHKFKRQGEGELYESYLKQKTGE
ncbi:MAG: hypothetical protein GF308_11150 [Candidatus Heimdallarchaeota archaeon]|nr:hypothetical protein [Candidatus Heimdallarchaeota archaeon]